MKNINPLSNIYYAIKNAYKISKLFLSVTLLVSLFTNCDNFVDVDLPNSQLTASTVYEEKATANAAMTQVYAKMRDAGVLTGYSNGLSNLLGNYADELTVNGSTLEGPVTFYNNVVLPSNANVKSLWNTSYEQIYGANAVLEGVSNSINLADSNRNQLKGEALFARALIHFYLTNLYGDVPYVETTDYQLNKIVTKKTSSVIYDKCIKDLQTAVTLLSSTYLTSDRTRPNKFAARALLARIYLYARQWDEASNEASAVINNSVLYPFETNISKIFLKTSTSTIWQFSANTAAGNTLEAQTFTFTAGPPSMSSVSSTLINSFPVGDQRKTLWINPVSNGITTWYSVSKYKNKGTGTSTEYSILLRLSEMYLIRAEARAQSGDLIGSKEDLNKIRNTAGLQNTPAITQNEILQAVLKERQLEFFAEYGHRFFDLKRFNALDNVLSITKPGWNTHEAFLPLPVSELILNKNINPQNNGY